MIYDEFCEFGRRNRSGDEVVYLDFRFLKRQDEKWRVYAKTRLTCLWWRLVFFGVLHLHTRLARHLNAGPSTYDSMPKSMLGSWSRLCNSGSPEDISLFLGSHGLVLWGCIRVEGEVQVNSASSSIHEGVANRCPPRELPRKGVVLAPVLPIGHR